MQKPARATSLSATRRRFNLRFLIAAAAILLLAIATFVPIPFVHPFRVARLRWLNVGLLAGWSVLAFVAVVRDMMPGPWITAGLCAIALYFLGAGLLRRPT